MKLMLRGGNLQGEEGSNIKITEQKRFKIFFKSIKKYITVVISGKAQAEPTYQPFLGSV